MDNGNLNLQLNGAALSQVPPLALVLLDNHTLLSDHPRFLAESVGKRATLRQALLQNLDKLILNRGAPLLDRPLIEPVTSDGELWISVAVWLRRKDQPASLHWALFAYPAKQWAAQDYNGNVRVWISQLSGETLALDGFETAGAHCGEDMPAFVPPGTARQLKNDMVAWLAETKELPKGEAAAARQRRAPILDSKGAPLLALITQRLVYDASGQVRAVLHAAFFPARQLQVEHEKQLAATVFETISEGIFITDREGFLIRANSAFYTMTGYAPGDIEGLHCSRLWEEEVGNLLFKTMRKAVDGGSNWRWDTTVVCKSGATRPVIISVTATRDSEAQVSHYVGVLVDMAEKKHNEQRIHRLAYFDALTEIPNRSLFFERLNHSLTQAQHNNEALAVLFLDLDRFKPINDSLGHTAGDQLLKAVARRLLYCIREHDTVARVGGDEFAILLTDLQDLEEAENIAVKTARRILAQFVTGFLVEGRDVYTSTSIGIALFPRDGQLPEELVRTSDMAMYAAKKGGKNNFHFYDSSMNIAAMERLVIDSALRKALSNDEFELYFQPQFRFCDSALAGVEVLLRWQHPRFGALQPTQFIEMAEETDLIIPIGEWVFEHACRTLAEWRAKGFDPGRMAINISGSQFKRPNLVEWLLWQISRHGLAPEQIEIEITESVVIADVERSMEVLNALRKAGIQIAIDDFGVGYSSLNYLRRFPINTLKIDRAFVRDLALEDGTKALTNAVIAIGKSLNLGVIAEGVESYEQFQYLKNSGCDWAQGHFLSPPLSSDDLLRFLQNKVPEEALAEGE